MFFRTITFSVQISKPVATHGHDPSTRDNSVIPFWFHITILLHTNGNHAHVHSAAAISIIYTYPEVI
jgi:hypothetical protein